MLIRNALHLMLLLAAATSAPVAFADGDEVNCATPTPMREAEDTCYAKVLKEECQAPAQALPKATCDAYKTAGADKTNISVNIVGAGSSVSIVAAQYGPIAAKCGKLSERCSTLCKGKDAMIPKCIDTFHAQQSDFEKAMASVGGIGQSLSASGASAIASGPSAGTNAAGSTAADTKPAPTTAAGGEKGGSGMKMGEMAQLGMMGALVGSAIAAQSGGDDDKDQAAAAAVNNNALQANNTVLCDKADSGMWAGCNSYLEQACTQAIQGNTYATSATCTTFGARYCTGGDGVTTDPVQTAATAAAATAPTAGIQGAGVKTAFCQHAIAYNYCIDGMHGGCPSCQNLANLTSLSCQTNPAACLAQSSGGSMANVPAICGADPMVVAAVATSTPAVVPVSSTAPLIGGVAVPTTSTLGVQTVLSQSGTKLTVLGRSTAAAGTPGPASDIGAEYGPSLTSITATAIQKRCETGQTSCP